jgi:hypothetical protein
VRCEPKKALYTAFVDRDQSSEGYGVAFGESPYRHRLHLGDGRAKLFDPARFPLGEIRLLESARVLVVFGLRLGVGCAFARGPMSALAHRQIGRENACQLLF